MVWANLNRISLSRSAAGDFTIDWGDGNVEKVTKSDTTNTTYSHTYDSAGEYTIGIGGEATAYDSDMFTAAISFSLNDNTAGISGSLGAIFGTLSDGTNPRFYQTFFSNTNLTGEIPADLFAGISGAPASYMFRSTFNGCSGLTGEIPLGLFGNLTNRPQTSMFSSTFYNCSGLTGPSARMPNGTYLYDFFTGATDVEVEAMYNGATGLEDYP